MTMASINPATGETSKLFTEYNPAEVARRIDQGHSAWPAWRSLGFDGRAALMRTLGRVLRSEQEECARMMALEMGKPVVQGRAEMEKCARVCEHYADHAARYLADEPLTSDASRSYVAFRPLGVLLAVMPWNFPFWQVFRFAAPALMAGNVAVLKHSSNVPRCALAVEDLFRQAGFPDGVFQTLLIGSRQVDEVIAHPLVRAVALTGSEQAGRQVAAKAGAMLKKTVLELGGSDPLVVLPGADLRQAAATGARSRCINSGQSCIAAKRFVVFEEVLEEFLDHLRQAMAALRVGNPLDEDTEVGPLARGDLRDELHQQVLASVAKGAELVLGGDPPPGPGFFYPPTILTGVIPGMPAYDEELFGPVAAVIRVRDLEEAVRVANDTPYGLGGSVWSGNVAEAETVAARIEAGAVFVNGMVKSDPRLPFGGIKASGYGRELSVNGIREFVNIQTVWIR